MLHGRVMELKGELGAAGAEESTVRLRACLLQHEQRPVFLKFGKKIGEMKRAVAGKIDDRFEFLWFRSGVGIGLAVAVNGGCC